MKKANKKVSTSSEVLVDIASRELSVINSYLETQIKLNSRIVSFLKDLAEALNCDTSYLSQKSLNLSTVLHKLSQMLVDSNSNISTLKQIKVPLLEALENPTKMTKTIQNFYEENASKFDEILSITSKIEKFLSTADIIEKLNELSSLEIDSEDISIENIDPKEEILDFSENTLLITDSKIVLPYKLSDLTNTLELNPEKYSNIPDVINDLYTRPASYYKSVSIARFKEAYSLAKKENFSFKSAIELAFELFFNYNLHPAIISACKNLNELDIYLSCLEYNELEDFKFFKIKYSITPSKSFNAFKKLKKTTDTITNE